jgi:hypothetical protein
VLRDPESDARTDARAQLAEMSSKKFLERLPANGDASKAVVAAVPDEDGWVPDPNCVDLGMGGCDSPTRKGGLKPALLKRALDSLVCSAQTRTRGQGCC